MTQQYYLVTIAFQVMILSRIYLLYPFTTLIIDE
ncbi:hypothetical protein GFV14_00509 [Candidatus Hartigia pinicola]|nr:hypothetical protein GFV14_00509 [Candidatus Hartigia pinicola]